MKIKSVMNTLLTDGSIFRYINSNNRYGSITPINLGVSYFGNSGMKQASSLLREYVNDEGILESSDIQLIANILLGIFGEQWDKKYSILHKTYEPIENYRRVETTTDSGTESNSGSNSITSENVVGAGSSTGLSSKYAFNSSTAQPDTSVSSTEAARTATVDSGTTFNDSKTSGNTHSSTISGNIGVTTSQQMIEAELELRNYNFLKEMFKDIDSIISIETYDFDSLTN